MSDTMHFILEIAMFVLAVQSEGLVLRIVLWRLT